MTDPTPAVEALDVDCEHAVVLAYRFDDPTHETFGRIALWGCQNCRRRFEPRALTPAQPVTETTDHEHLLMYDASYRMGWERARAEVETTDLRAAAVLRDHALGIAPHRFAGQCPDPTLGPDVRDPQCPVCAALDTPSPASGDACDHDPECVCLVPAHVACCGARRARWMRTLYPGNPPSAQPVSPDLRAALDDIERVLPTPDDRANDRAWLGLSRLRAALDAASPDTGSGVHPSRGLTRLCDCEDPTQPCTASGIGGCAMSDPTPEEALPIYCTGACDACRDYARELGVPLIVSAPPRLTPAQPVSPDLRAALDALYHSASGTCWRKDCPSPHEGAADDCLDAALELARAALARQATPASGGLDVDAVKHARSALALAAAVARSSESTETNEYRRVMGRGFLALRILDGTASDDERAEYARLSSEATSPEEDAR